MEFDFSNVKQVDVYLTLNKKSNCVALLSRYQYIIQDIIESLPHGYDCSFVGNDKNNLIIRNLFVDYESFAHSLNDQLIDKGFNVEYRVYTGDENER